MKYNKVIYKGEDIYTNTGLESFLRMLISTLLHRQLSRLRYILRMPLPGVQPIIPVSSKEPFDDPDWLFEFKYDGYRALCNIEPGRSRFISRRGNYLDRFRALSNQIAAELGVEDAILNGELVAADETGRSRFYDLLRRARPSYVAFDFLWLNGADLSSFPLSNRRRCLHGILPKHSSIITEALSVEGRARELFELMRSHDLEGIVAKRLADPYGPRTRWLKFKNPDYSQKEGRGELMNRRK